MRSDPVPPTSLPNSTSPNTDDDSEVQEKLANGHADEEYAPRLTAIPTLDDKEKSRKIIGHYHIVNDIWQYFSVDYGHRCTYQSSSTDMSLCLWSSSDDCIGYNSLYTVDNVSFSTNSSLPDCKRVWTWLLLCDDG
jgi:hypothetical protein